CDRLFPRRLRAAAHLLALLRGILPPPAHRGALLGVRAAGGCVTALSAPPKGFAAAYRRARRDLASPEVLSGRLALIGYDVPPSVHEAWPLDKRVEADVYAVNVRLRASDTPLRRCPKPDWLPAPSRGEYQQARLVGRAQ